MNKEELKTLVESLRSVVSDFDKLLVQEENKVDVDKIAED